MSTPSNVIRVPRPQKSSYNPDRPVAKNTLLLHHIQHLRHVEMKLPPEKQSGMDFEKIETEKDAGEYIRRMTAILHPHGSKVKKAG